MPGSSVLGKDVVFDWLSQNESNIKDILDIGPGMGTYFDLYNSRFPNSSWDCVEIWEPYLYQFFLHKKYENIYNIGANEFIPSKNYDLVILGDVLEHIDKSEAIKLIDALRNYCKYYIISLPLDAETGVGAGTGDVDWGNPFELHRAKWTFDEFINMHFHDELVVKKKYKELAVFIGESSIYQEISTKVSGTKKYEFRGSAYKLYHGYYLQLASIFRRIKSKIIKELPTIKKYTPKFIKTIIKKARYIIFHPIIMITNPGRRLNIGAGVDKLPGFLHIDSDPTTGPDIERDIEKGLPFDDNSVDEIKCSHVLEHIKDLLFVLREFYRVSKNGAKITIIVPLMDASDMTHIRFFDENTFRTLTESEYWNKPYYYVGKYKEESRSFRQLSTCRDMTLVLRVIK